jgi:hypothetical protein
MGVEVILRRIYAKLVLLNRSIELRVIFKIFEDSAWIQYQLFHHLRLWVFRSLAFE